MNGLPVDLIEEYIILPSMVFGSDSKNLFVAVADGGNHFLEDGIREGTELVFDRENPYQKGQLSCFLDNANNIHLLKQKKRGYAYLGRPIAAISVF